MVFHFYIPTQLLWMALGGILALIIAFIVIVILADRAFRGIWGWW